MIFTAVVWQSCQAFTIPATSHQITNAKTKLGKSRSTTTTTGLFMGLDLVTSLRVEWIAANLCTNQTPRTADVCLQLGSEDGKAVQFVPKTIDKLITSTLEADGVTPIKVKRLIQQQEQARGVFSVEVADQRADDLKFVDDESVDVVVSLTAVPLMIENGLDWKKSVQEAARVLKPGGRMLFVEQDDVNGESYLDYLANLNIAVEGRDGTEENPVFIPIGYDDVDYVLTPHVAGVVVKSEDAGLTAEEKAARVSAVEDDRMAEISLSAFERGLKKRRKKKKQQQTSEDENKST